MNRATSVLWHAADPWSLLVPSPVITTIDPCDPCPAQLRGARCSGTVQRGGMYRSHVIPE